MELIKYHLRTNEEGQTVAGWRMSLDDEEYGNEVILDDGYTPDADLENIVIYNAGDSLATIIMGPHPFEDMPDDPSTAELLKLEATLAGRRELVKVAETHFQKHGWYDERA